MEEIWKDIEGYDNYQVSSLGRIKNTKTGRYLTPSKAKFGYRTVTLRKDNRGKTHKVHILVAKHFIMNPNAYPEINHKDEDKGNNCVANLEWCTHKYNINYGTRNKRMIATRIKNRLKSST